MPLTSFSTVCLLRATSGGAQSLGFVTVTAGVATLTGVPSPLPLALTSTYCFVRSLPSDRQIVYVTGIPLGTGRCVIYRFNGHTSTWTLLLDVTGTNNFSCPVEICFMPTDEIVYAAVGTWNTRAQNFHQSLSVDGVAGVYKSIAGSAFTLIGTGQEHGYNGGNINHPNTLTAMTLVHDTPMKIVTLHCQTPSNVLLNQSVMDVSTDDGVTWSAIPAGISAVTGFMYTVLSQLQYMASELVPFYFFGMDTSGVGAYALPNQTSIFAEPSSFVGGLGVAGPYLSGAMAVLFNDGSQKGFMYDTNGRLHVYQLTANGTGSTEIIPDTAGFTAGWRSYCVHESEPTAVIVYEGLTGADGGFYWTTDGGASWTAFDPLGFSIIGVDFGMGSEPSTGGIFPQSATFRDARGETARTLTYLSASSTDEARTFGEAIIGAISDLSTARFEIASGAWTSSPIIQLPGPGGVYNTVEERAVISFVDTNGGIIQVEIPAPKATIFNADGEALDLANPGLMDSVAILLANGLCGRGGFQAASWLGGRRIQSRRRRRMNVYTLNPDENEPAE
jgi:hypothetical protein